MKRQIKLKHEFVEYIPDKLKDETVYVSLAFSTAAHKCCCGCGNEVITPLSPTDWKLISHGESISLYPSIGNWNFPCRSHYWIDHNRVKWAPQWSQARINAGRAHDTFIKDEYFGNASHRGVHSEKADGKIAKSPAKMNFWQKILKWFS